MQNLTVGITGGIGSGKSVVSRILRCNGYQVYDCDSNAKFLMNSDPGLKMELKRRLGKDIYTEDGQLDRKKMANLLFTDEAVRKFVNKIVHEAVRKDILYKREKSKKLFFIESAILVTGGISDFCKQIWIVTAPKSIRIRRVELRDKMDREEIEKRMESQQKELSLLDKQKTIILENDGEHPILVKVLKLIEEYNNNQIITISC